MHHPFHQRNVLFAGLLGVLAVGSPGVAAGEGLKLTAEGQPRATIVLAEKPTGSAQLAAFELQHYLKKISGATLPIVREPRVVAGIRILVGESTAVRKLGYGNNNLKEQEYIVKTMPDTLLLTGYDGQHFPQEVLYHGDSYTSFNSIYREVCYPRGLYGWIGTCYAVHDFLENTLGVRWYYPNEAIGEVIPVSATVTVKDLNIRRKPDAPNRPIYPLFSNTEQLYFTDWDQPAKFQSAWVNARTSLLYWIRNRHWGGMLYNANHSFGSYGEAFGKSHPEWFSTKSYAKMKQLDYQTGIQPCFSAPGFFEQVVQLARDYFDGKPEPFPGAYCGVGNSFAVMPNDNTNMCGCDACRAQYRNDVGPDGNASHYVWSFVNRVAKEVRKTHPQAIISCCAYFNYTTPPKGLVFEPNVAVTFCKFYTGYANRNYQQQDYRRIAEYAGQNKATFFTTWEYELKPHINEWAFPCLVPHVHADDVKHLSAIRGFKGGIDQFLYMTAYSGTTPGGVAQVSPVLDFMNLYWRMKLYDNFTLDINQALDEYYETFFGPGAAGMKKFYTAMEDRWMKVGAGADSRTWWGKLGTPDFLKEITGYIQQARAATKEGTLYHKRVDLIDAGILQHMLKARARYEKSAISEFAPVGTAAVARVKTPASPEDWTADTTWAEALPNTIEKTLANEPVPQKTVFKLAYDDRNLYIYARCLEPKVAQMKSTIREKDVGGFSDDSIELFVDPPGQSKTYYQFCINSLGAVYDALEDPYAIGATANVTWNSGIQVKTTVGKDYWEVRAALPFAGLVKKAPKPGETWRFNLCRNRYAEPDKPPFSAWSPTPAGFKDPEQFGILTFNAPEDRGRALWNCDFESGAFASTSGESPLIGCDGWYEDTAYANQGWDKSWKVVQRGDNRLAVCDVNATNPSTVVPMHAVQVSPGVIGVEVDYRRLNPAGSQPQLIVADRDGRYLLYMYISGSREDEAGCYLRGGDTQSFRDERHGLGGFSASGQWFGMKVEINTVTKRTNSFIRKAGGAWVRLNKTPLPYYLSDAEAPSHLFISVGTRRLNQGPLDNNTVEMDHIRVTQLSSALVTKH